MGAVIVRNATSGMIIYSRATRIGVVRVVVQCFIACPKLATYRII